MEDSVETNADAINSQSEIKNQEDKTDEASEREEKNESPLDPSDPAPVNEWNEVAAPLYKCICSVIMINRPIQRRVETN